VSPDIRHNVRRRGVAWAVIPWVFVITAEVATAAADEAGNAYASLTADYREGDFGTTVNNELYSLTPEFGYVSSSYDLSASIPLHHLSVSGGGLSSSESGLGDAVLRGGRRLWRDKKAETSLNGALTIKLATGDENKGLGTGGTDIGVFLSATRKRGAYAFTALASGSIAASRVLMYLPHCRVRTPRYRAVRLRWNSMWGSFICCPWIMWSSPTPSSVCRTAVLTTVWALASCAGSDFSIP
jgi:hypothetical protein